MRTFFPAVCIFLVACTNPYPISVPKPPYSQGDTLNVEYDALVKYVQNYGQSLRIKSHQLMSQKYAYTDFGYLGSIVSVIAAASGALTTALYGGGVAVGGSMTAQHYNYDTQVQNYNEARKKVQCIYQKLSERTVNESLLIKDDVNNEIVRIIRPTINSALDDIYFDLESKQSSIELKPPDLKKLSDAFAQQKKVGSKMAVYNAGLYSAGNNSESRLILAQSIQASVSICKVMGDSP